MSKQLLKEEDRLNQRYANFLEKICWDVILEKDSFYISFTNWFDLHFESLEQLEWFLIYNDQ